MVTKEKVIKVHYLSLWEYMGTAAGKYKGGGVWELAKKEGIIPEKQHISNPVYTGTVTLYPEYWLDKHFAKDKRIQSYYPNGVIKPFDFSDKNNMPF